MSRTEGSNQPDLLNIFRKREPDAPTPRPAVPATPPPQDPLKHSTLSALGPASTRASSARPTARRDLVIIIALGLIVAVLIVAVIMRDPKPAPGPASAPGTPPPRPAAARPAGAKPGPAPKPAAQATPTAPLPAAPGDVRLYTRATSGSGRSFYTLILATYPGTKLAEAQATCRYLQTKGKDYADTFLYRTANAQTGAGELRICVGRFDPAKNPVSDRKASDLERSLRQMPNASGRREFSDCYFSKLTVNEP